MDTTGNNTVACAGQGCQPGTLGSIQDCGVIATVGGTLTVDIVVNAIPNTDQTVSGAGPNIQGFDMDLIYDPLIVSVSALPANAGSGGPPGNLGMEYAGTPGGSHSSNTESVPSSDGDFFMGEIDFGANGESGPGILMRLTLSGVANGQSSLAVVYTTGGFPNPNIYDNSGAQNTYTIANNQVSTVKVGGTCP